MLRLISVAVNLSQNSLFNVPGKTLSTGSNLKIATAKTIIVVSIVNANALHEVADYSCT